MVPAVCCATLLLAVVPRAPQSTATVDHSAYDRILEDCVRDEGVDYLRLRSRHYDALCRYLDSYEKLDLSRLRRHERLAALLDLYDATLLRTVAERFHDGYRTDEDGSTLFREPLVRLGEERLSLDALRDERIRPEFHEPRIHVALSDGTRSCPPLIARAYEGAHVREVLEDSMVRFVRDPVRNPVSAAGKELRISRLFDWYEEDFGGPEGVLATFARYHPTDLGGRTIVYADYDRRLNLALPREGRFVVLSAATEAVGTEADVASAPRFALRAGEVFEVVGEEGEKLSLDLGLGRPVARIDAAVARSWDGTTETPVDGAKSYRDTMAGFLEPDPRVGADGRAVRTAQDWWEWRRPQILEEFRRSVYGRVPEGARIREATVGEERPALGGRARRYTVSLRYGVEADRSMEIVVHLPSRADGPFPLFLGLTFFGVAAAIDDPTLPLDDRWKRESESMGIVQNRATEATRGKLAHRWPIERILERGYGLALADYGDLDPDFADGFHDGVHGSFDPPGAVRADDAWGSIAAWAFGLSRALDAFEGDPRIDASRVAVIGHSRLGKTALWAGAQDPRFWLVISNDSGCGGAANFRRRQGETIRAINDHFPHWFCRRFHEYGDREHELPVDQHLLLAAIAPRPLYVASAAEDSWADPEGEFLSVLGADPVYRLLGTEGYPGTEPPPVDTPVHGTLGYHVRSGGHDLTAYDWERFLDFADRHRRD